MGDSEMELLYYIAVAWLIITNIIAIVLTIHDKIAALKNKWRVPEKTLLLWAALSGCIGMYITMRLIRHKTRKQKFMVGIPAIFFLEAAAFAGIYYLLHH